MSTEFTTGPDAAVPATPGSREQSPLNPLSRMAVRHEGETAELLPEPEFKAFLEQYWRHRVIQGIQTEFGDPPKPPVLQKLCDADASVDNDFVAQVVHRLQDVAL